MEKKYWLHRISHEWDVSYALLDKNYLSIGWVSIANTDVLKNIDADNRENFDKKFSGQRSRFNLWNFGHMKKGDIVLVPLFNGKFSLYKAVDNPKSIVEMENELSSFESKTKETIVYDKTKHILIRKSADNKNDTTVDIGFLIKVEPIKTELSRYSFIDNAISKRLKIRQTNSEITDLKDSIKKIIKAKGPINIYSLLVDDLAKKILDVIKSELTDNKFEQLIGWYFKKMGASYVTIPAKNESGKKDGADADIIAEFNSLGIIFYIQAKQHVGETSDWAVKQINNYVNQKGSSDDSITAIPWVISTCDKFSDDAIALASENNIRLIDGIDFAKLLINAGITDIDSAFD